MWVYLIWYFVGEEESIVCEMIDMLLIIGLVSVKKFCEVIVIMMSCKWFIKVNYYFNE